MDYNVQDNKSNSLATKQPIIIKVTGRECLTGSNRFVNISCIVLSTIITLSRDAELIKQLI